MTTTIDITPTWQSLVPVLVELSCNGTTAEARSQAMAELMRLARAVDAMNDSTRDSDDDPTVD